MVILLYVSAKEFVYKLLHVCDFLPATISNRDFTIPVIINIVINFKSISVPLVINKILMDLLSQMLLIFSIKKVLEWLFILAADKFKSGEIEFFVFLGYRFSNAHCIGREMTLLLFL